MGMAKRNNKMNKKIDNVNTNFKEEFMKVIKVLVIVLGIFGGFYLLTLYITNRDSKSKYTSDVNEATIQYSEILAGSSFSKDVEYVVIYYDKSNENINSVYTDLVSTYKDKEEHYAIYTVDMSSSFNKPFIAASSNSSPKDSSELRIVGPTLIKFKDGVVSDYLEGEGDITSYLS